MDAKTFEYMNERVKKFNEVQSKIKNLKEKVSNIEQFGFESVYFTISGNYKQIPYIDKDLMKETLLKLMNDKIAVLEKELEEI